MGKVVFLGVLWACNKLCDAVIIAQNERERVRVCADVDPRCDGNVG